MFGIDISSSLALLNKEKLSIGAKQIGNIHYRFGQTAHQTNEITDRNTNREKKRESLQYNIKTVL